MQSAIESSWTPGDGVALTDEPAFFVRPRPGPTPAGARSDRATRLEAALPGKESIQPDSAPPGCRAPAGGLVPREGRRAVRPRRCQVLLAEGRRLALARLRPDAFPEVARVYAACPTFFRLLTGSAEVPAAHVRADMTEAPPGFDPARKLFWGVYLGEELVGVADFLVGWPSAGRGCLGLLLIAEPWQGRGLGRAAVALIERHVREEHGVTEITLGVELVNARGAAFWRAVGYAPTGEVFEHEVMGRIVGAEELGKRLG